MRIPTSPTDRSGFTLLELMLVIVVIGAVSALVFVNLDVLIPGQRLRSAAGDLIAAAELARSHARLTQTTVTLEYDLDNRTWSIIAPPMLTYDEEEPSSPQAAPEVLVKDRLADGFKISRVHYSESGVASSGTVSADFRPSGAVGGHMVVLEETPGGTISVFVPALTGSAFVVEKGAVYEEIRSRRRLQ